MKISKPVAWFPLIRDANDLVNHNDGTLVNCPTFIADGPSGGGIEFDGISKQIVKLPIAHLIRKTTTFAMFVKQTTSEKLDAFCMGSERLYNLYFDLGEKTYVFFYKNYR